MTQSVTASVPRLISTMATGFLVDHAFVCLRTGLKVPTTGWPLFVPIVCGARRVPCSAVLLVVFASCPQGMRRHVHWEDCLRCRPAWPSGVGGQAVGISANGSSAKLTCFKRPCAGSGSRDKKSKSSVSWVVVDEDRAEGHRRTHCASMSESMAAWGVEPATTAVTFVVGAEARLASRAAAVWWGLVRVGGADIACVVPSGGEGSSDTRGRTLSVERLGEHVHRFAD